MDYFFPVITTSLPLWLLIVVLVLTGFVVGIVSGMLGVGGGFLIIPVLNIGLGFDLPLAMGCSSGYVLGASFAGVINHLKAGNLELQYVLFSLPGVLAGSFIGDFIQDLIAGQQGLLSTLFAGILIVFALVQIFYHKNDDPVSEHKIHFVPLLLIGFAGGLLPGLLGIAGGILYIPLLVIAVGLTQKKAIGTSLGMVFIGVLFAVIKKAWMMDPLHPKLHLGIIAGLLALSFFGVRIGAALCVKLKSSHLRIIFAALMLCMSVIVLVKTFL